MLDLSALHGSLPEIIEIALNELRTAGAHEVGERCERLCLVFRTAATSALFIDFDPDSYRHMLKRSGLTRRFLLNTVSDDEKATSRFCKISRTNGLLDAVAAHDMDLAKAIIAASPSTKNAQFEYEDDYAYARVLHLFVSGQDDEIRGALDVLETALAGPAVRLEVCSALESRNADAFDEAFQTLLSTRREEILAAEKSLSRDEMEFVSARHLFVEGLALLQIAANRRIAVKPEYDLCPREAMRPAIRPFPGDLYPH